MSDIALVRQQFAQRLRDAKLRSPRLIAAFASVPRERFLGDGPWSVGVLTDKGEMRYERTASADPAEVYRDTVIAIDPSRGLNNGEPSSLAQWIDALAIAPGDTVVHVGTGTGYYTAILAELVGPHGRVIGVEADAALAARARENLAAYGHAVVRNVDESSVEHASVDAMFVNCGVTHPATRWIASLRVGGRLLVPVTAARDSDGIGVGAMYLALRGADDIAMRFVSTVGIFPCIGQRSDELNRELLAKERDSWRDVRTLRIDAHSKMPSCWLHADECCLSRNEPIRPHASMT